MSSRASASPLPTPATPATSKTLDTLRRDIDRLDDRLLDLIEARLALSGAIAALKREETDRRLALRPRREATVIARLTARARRVPPALVAHTWRALMSYGLQAQVRTAVVICGTDAALRRQVEARFGPAVAIRTVATPDEALAAAREGEVVAVIPDGLPYALEPDDALIAFETLEAGGAGGAGDDAGKTGQAVAIGRVAPADAILAACVPR